MKKIKSAILRAGVVSVLLGLSSFLVLSKANATSIGVSPARLTNKNLMPGSRYQQEFIVSRSESDVAADVEIEIQGDEIKDWLTVTPDGMKMPQGTNSVKFTVTVKVPNDATAGKYEGSVLVQIVDEEKEGQVILVPGAKIEANLTVSDKEIDEYSVKKATIATHHQGEKLVMEVELDNTGNVPVAPMRAEIAISDINNKEVKEIESVEIKGEVDAFSMGTVQIIFDDPELDVGSYYGDLKIYDDGKMVYEDKILFKVEEALPQPTAKKEEEDEESNVVKIILYIGLTGILVAAVVVVVVKMKQQSGAGEGKKKSEKKEI